MLHDLSEPHALELTSLSNSRLLVIIVIVFCHDVLFVVAVYETCILAFSYLTSNVRLSVT